MNNEDKRNKKLAIIEIIIICITLYIFKFPDILIGDGYGLSVNGVVAGRALFLIFALSRIPKIFELLLKK